MLLENCKACILGVVNFMLIVVLLFVQSGSVAAISIGQIDDFTDTTLQNWAMGSKNVTASHMINIADGGPAGSGDRFLRVVADGINVAGGRLTFFNKAQWMGDYLGAGISTISMDINNFSLSQALELRLAIDGGFLDSSFNIVGGLFATSVSMVLDSGSGWTHVVFSLAPGDLIPVSGRISTLGNDVMATLGNVKELRLLNSASPDWSGQPVIATLGIDNITAVVPLPSAALLLCSGLIGLGMMQLQGERRVAGIKGQYLA